MSSSILDVHVISENDYVECKICNCKLEKIDGRHTKKKHGISFVEYKKMFPNTPTITKTKLNKELQMIERRKEAKKKKEEQTKMIKCCNPECPTPEQEFSVNINVSTNHTLCPNCKKNGVINPKTIEIHDSQIKGLFKKYGVINPSQLDEVQEKKKENLERKKEENPDYFKEIQEKRKETNTKRYGNDWKKVLDELSEQGMERIHGERRALQIQKFLKKAQNTYFKKTGYNSPFENPEVQESIKITNKKNTGYDNVMKCPEIAKKAGVSMKETWKKQEVRQKHQDAYIKKFIPRLLQFLNDVAYLELLEEYQNAHYQHKWKCLKCKYIFTKNWNDIQQGFTCPNCRPYVSKLEKYKTEKEVADFIQTLNFDIVRGNRSFINPYELDILIHSKKIAIEYCGLFWHNEDKIKETRKNIEDPTKYHLFKLEQCNKLGYNLITIFEDEWIFKKDIVKSRLKNLLGVNDGQRIHARKCIIKEIDPTIKNEFLDKFHVQGKDNSTIKLGAFYNNELISVMTFGKGNISKGSKSKDGVWELNRFCSDYNYHIPGIASKLLAYFKRNYEWTEIFSYADLRWSNGNLYNKLGFKYSGHTGVNYWYIKRYQRIHRFNLRKTKNDPKDIPEWVLRQSEGYLTIWDCGSLKFKLINK